MVKLCIGSAQFGMNYGIANKKGQPTQTEINEILMYAANGGVRYIDTAQAYGDSERTIGKALESNGGSCRYDIITKLSPDGINYDEETIVESAMQSCGKLSTDNLFGFLAHRIELFNRNEFIEACSQLKRRGIIENSGVSVYSPGEALEAIEEPHCNILQIPFNVLDKRWIECDIFGKAKSRNVHVFVRSIFLQGVVFLSSEELIQKNKSWMLPYLKSFHELLRQKHCSILELTLCSIAEYGGQVTIILGVETLDQIKENIMHVSNSISSANYCQDWWDNLPTFPERFLNPSKW
jgi:aryl-alcohol dehydrogenase-like predicted oxidoreductase